MHILLSPILCLDTFGKQIWKVYRMNGESIKTRTPTAKMRPISSLPASHPSPSVNTLAIRTRTAKTPPSHLAAAMSGIAICVLAPVTTLPGPVKVTFCFNCTRHYNIARTPVQIHVRADATWEGAGGRRRHTILASLRRSRKSLTMRARDGTELKGCNMGSTDYMSENR